MITEDYIMRLIRLAAEFIAKALGLAKEGDFLAGEETLANGLRDLTGISLETLVAVDPRTLESMAGGDDASVFMLAEFLVAMAEIELAKGRLDLYYSYLKKSLRLYLAIHVNEDLETDAPIYSVYEKVKEGIWETRLLDELLGFFNGRGDIEKSREIREMLDGIQAN
ncbi:MAG: hypothetical protein JXB33_10695 [Clostridia bacterium]|nr:hypothetical protein [Clostridia bacterium]